jgi:hypothetical protein
LTLNSPHVLTELKSFTRSAGSYSAQTGATDDRIMACIVVFYVIQAISHTNANAYDMVYSVASEIEERHGWTLDTVVSTDNDRSDMLNRYFDNLHNDKNELGFTMG